MFNDDLTEYSEKSENLKKKVRKLAKLIKNSKHCVIHTGAGISTSAGIPDFRGPNGVWTCRDQGRKRPRRTCRKSKPTYAHMSISKLIEKGYVKYLVSQNCDGLHVKSGVPLDKISELHGNTNKESCKDCKKDYWRPYRCRNSKKCHDHRTGRLCDECGGELHDTIINYNENLNETQLNRAYQNSEKSDLSIVCGTSLKVTPSSSLPVITVKNETGKLVICNLQKTPKDKYASLRIFSKTDLIFELLMKELDLTPDEYVDPLENENENENKNKNKKNNKKEKEKEKEKSSQTKNKKKTNNKEKTKTKTKTKKKSKTNTKIKK
ncbi:nad-dependent protein deacetylase sirtuin-7 [Anaeramoeba flamelloides]|uniref:Nad-dependent protein deacetylase sirtuin-7 n=1 Tax=Anaeramoeba flamelloides TaxID=1746091 RepID=A0ABQ8Z9T6_9EUKA|nr:nad-dependent protein deacetylase sirtuin-7 [Anaeramoeba flamelloides]